MVMKSPFPGMDPYLEAHWLDVHPRLIVEASNQLQGQLGESLIARIEERLIVEDPASGDSRRIGPDLRIVEYGASESTVQPARNRLGGADRSYCGVGTGRPTLS